MKECKKNKNKNNHWETSKRNKSLFWWKTWQRQVIHQHNFIFLNLNDSNDGRYLIGLFSENHMYSILLGDCYISKGKDEM